MNILGNLVIALTVFLECHLSAGRLGGSRNVLQSACHMTPALPQTPDQCGKSIRKGDKNVTLGQGGGSVRI